MRALLAFAAAAAAVTALAGPRADSAAACSCESPVPSRDLPKFDAAFVGTVSSHRIEGTSAFWTFDVEQAVKGTLRTPLVVRAASSGAACGLELGRGERTGLLLRYDRYSRTRYESGLCYQADPEALARAALPGARLVGTQSSSAPWWPVGLAVGAVAALAFAALALRRRG